MCKISAATIAADGKAVGTALDQIANLVAPTNPTLAADLTTAGNGIISATANWQSGSDTAILEDAENVAIDALNLIPVTAPYAALVAIAFAALNLLLANTQTQAAVTGNAIPDAHALLSHATTINTDSPWAGKAVIPHQHGRDFRKDFEASWNAAGKPFSLAPITV